MLREPLKVVGTRFGKMDKFKKFTEDKEEKRRKESEEARREGYRAYQDGLKREDNPYGHYVDGRDDHKADSWAQGHSDAGWDD